MLILIFYKTEHIKKVYHCITAENSCFALIKLSPLVLPNINYLDQLREIIQKGRAINIDLIVDFQLVCKRLLFSLRIYSHESPGEQLLYKLP